MKKTIILSACIAAALCAQSFAENATGKITGISVSDSTASITIAEGVVDPFSNTGFTASGKTITESMPLNVAVEFFRPSPKSDKKVQKDLPARPNMQKAGNAFPRAPKMNVKQLHIDQLVSFVYAENDSTVEKILIQAPKIQAPKIQASKMPSAARQPAAQNKRGNNKNNSKPKR